MKHSHYLQPTGMCLSFHRYQWPCCHTLDCSIPNPVLIINLREIQRLRNKVKELQEQVKKATEEAQAQTQKNAQPLGPTGYATPPSSTTYANGANCFSDLSNTKREWEGIQDSSTRAGAIYYGPMSSSYFVTRITRYLSEALNQPFSESQLHACVAQLNNSTSPQQPSRSGASPLAQDGSVEGTEEVVDLTRSQEEYFLNLLWQSFHCVYPIISEADFRQYYDSLWFQPRPDGQHIRKRSPLVDVLLAVCMQYGSTFLINDEDSQGSEKVSHAENANMVGQAFYRRSQKFLSNRVEHPSIMTLQTHIYAIIYLYNSSLLNAAHINLGVAVRIGHALRLHLCPLDGTTREEQELHRRIWWTLYRLDSQLSMTLGRPPLIHTSDISCGLPGDDRDHARLSGTMLLSDHEDISWLSFHNQCIRLTAAVCGVQTAFRNKCSELLNANDVQDIYDDPRTTEIIAGFLARESVVIQEWVQNVPNSLKNYRNGAGEPFSVYRATLSLDPYIPLWLQRQRLLLELLYHHFQISTLRPFLRFPPVATSLTPLADGHNTACLNHAMAMTSILNQVLLETDLLRGWSFIFQYQWDAILCTLGFILANPVCPPTPSARKSLQTAISTLEHLGSHFSAAINAAQVAREVSCRAELLTERFRESLAAPQRRSTQSSPSQQTQGLSLKQVSPSNVAPQSLQANNELQLSQIPSLEFIPPTTSLTELSSTIAATNLPLSMSADMFNGNRAHWMQSNSTILDSWTDFNPEV